MVHDANTSHVTRRCLALISLDKCGKMISSDFNLHLVSLLVSLLHPCVSLSSSYCTCDSMHMCLCVYARVTVNNFSTLLLKASFSSVLHMCLRVCVLALACTSVCLYVCVCVCESMYRKTCGFAL